MWYIYTSVTILVIILLFIILKLYNKWKCGWCNSRAILAGKVVLITGGNTGIGYETAVNIAKRGAKVIIACRDELKGEQAVKAITETTKNTRISYAKLDLSSLKSIRDFVADFNAKEVKLDVLINNAGISGLQDRKTDDGIVYDMQVNHFGPFLLTILLLPLLRKADYSRVVIVSSVQHKRGEINFETINEEKTGGLATLKVYSIAKLCNVLFSNELARRVGHTNITVNSLHPGHVNTSIYRNVGGVVEKIMKIWLGTFYKSPIEGAQTSIYLAVSEDVEGVSGRYYDECKEAKMSKTAMDEELAEKLWSFSEKMVGLRNEERFWETIDSVMI